jgi:hypothetical protein
VDNRQINLTRFPLFFPEKRAVFLENAGVFDFGRSVVRQQEMIPFFSRRIGLLDGREVPIFAGTKLTGKAGKFDIDALAIRTQQTPLTDAKNYFAGRFKRNLFKQSFIGALYTEGATAPKSRPRPNVRCRRLRQSFTLRRQMKYMMYQLLLLFLLCPACASAQTTSSAVTGAITGVVFDQNEAVVSNARVTLQEAGKTTKTDQAGRFRFERISAGEHRLFITRDGFKAETVHLTLTARALAPLRIVLAVADVRQEIIVSENTSQVSTETGNNQDVASVDREMLDTLPSLGQDYIGTMAGFLNAGATGTSGVTLIVDGMEAVKAGVSASGIQEVRINNNPYSAEYARPGRARIEIITKPGSDRTFRTRRATRNFPGASRSK